jgi:transcriptional regulator NrdR family protein
MTCPSCNSEDHQVLATRDNMPKFLRSAAAQYPEAVVRKRRCKACSHLWWTAEITVIQPTEVEEEAA